MKVETKYHGEIEVNEQDVLSFPNGIPGFLEEKEFVLFPFADDTPFYMLQSTKNQSLGFVVTNPLLFFKDYDFTIPDQVVEQLKIESEKDIAVYSILTVQDPFEKSTTNLQGPVLINPKKQLGRQIILQDPNYQTKHALFKENSSVGQEG